MKIKMTANATPEVATTSLRTSCVRFCQAKGVRSFIEKCESE